MKLRKKILALVFVVAMMVGSINAKGHIYMCLSGNYECEEGSNEGFTFATCGLWHQVQADLEFWIEHYC